MICRLLNRFLPLPRTVTVACASIESSMLLARQVYIPLLVSSTLEMSKLPVPTTSYVLLVLGERKKKKKKEREKRISYYLIFVFDTFLIYRIARITVTNVKSCFPSACVKMEC